MASEGYYPYDPSFPAATTFCAIFTVSTIIHLYQMLFTGTWYLIPFFIGGVFEAVGFGARAVNANQTTQTMSFTPFIIQTIGILLAPTLIAASIYMGLGRIIELVGGSSLSLIRRSWMTKIFVGGDILSFFLQAAGASMLTKTSDPKSLTNGKKTILFGLWVQIFFFGFFLLNAVIFWSRLTKNLTSRSKFMPWKKHLTVLLVAGILILIRSIYRVIEYAQGTGGQLISHEVYQYVLDAALMLIVAIIFNVFHPSEVQALLRGRGKYFIFLRSYHVEGRVIIPLSSTDGRQECQV